MLDHHDWLVPFLIVHSCSGNIHLAHQHVAHGINLFRCDGFPSQHSFQELNAIHTGPADAQSELRFVFNRGTRAPVHRMVLSLFLQVGQQAVLFPVHRSLVCQRLLGGFQNFTILLWSTFFTVAFNTAVCEGCVECMGASLGCTCVLVAVLHSIQIMKLKRDSMPAKKGLLRNEPLVVASPPIQSCF